MEKKLVLRKLVSVSLTLAMLVSMFTMLNLSSSTVSAEGNEKYMLQMQRQAWQYVYQQIMVDFEPGANYRFSADVYVYAGKTTFLLDVHKPDQDNAVRARFDPTVDDTKHHYSADFTAPDAVCTSGERAKITVFTRDDYGDGKISDFIAGNISIYKLDGSGEPTGDNMVKDPEMATGLSSNTWSSSANPWYSNGTATTAGCRFVPQPDGIFDSDSTGKQLVTLNDVSWGYVRQHVTNNFTANAKYRFSADAKALVGTTTIILKVCNGSNDYETTVRFDPKPDDTEHHYTVDFTAPSSVATSGERAIIEIFTRDQVDGHNPSVTFANISIYKLSGDDITGDNLVNDSQLFTDFGTDGWSTGANPWFSSLSKGTDYVKANLTDGFFDAVEHTEHMLGDWVYDAINHWKECSICLEKVDIAAHTASDWIIDREAGVGVTGHKHQECTVCKKVLAEEDIPAHEHTPGEAVKENEKAATCTEDGSYDLVVYCSDADCGEELSRETVTVEKIDHTAAEAVKENEVAATYTADGSYDEVVYCSVCNAEISRNTVKVPMKVGTFKITYNLNGGKNNSANPASFKSNAAITLKTPTRTGYKFEGWYKDSAFSSKITTISKGTAKNVTVYAKWSAVTYKLTYKLNGGKNGKNPASFNVTTATITLKNPTRAGYKFGGWFTDSKFKNKITKITKGTAKNVTLYAKWSVVTYKLTYKLNGGKNGKNPKSYKVTTKTFTLKAATRKGYTFKGWYSDSKFKKKVTKIAKGSTGNKTLYAKWAKK